MEKILKISLYEALLFIYVADQQNLLCDGIIHNFKKYVINKDDIISEHIPEIIKSNVVDYISLFEISEKAFNHMSMVCRVNPNDAETYSNYLPILKEYYKVFKETNKTRKYYKEY